jgi:two-component system chemotaxis sensor kinase CheA
MDRHQTTFLEEARELLTDLEEALLAIENDPQNMEIIGKIFRTMHTIKGSSAMFGFDAIRNFTHELENAFDYVREGKMPVTHQLITLTLASRDHISNLLDYAELEHQPENAFLQGGEQILAKLQTLLPTTEQRKKPDEPKTPTVPEEATGPQKLFRVRFRPPQNIYLTGSNPQYLIDEIKEMGECEVILHSDGLPPVDQINPDFCYFRWDVLVSTVKDAQAIRDIFIFVEDESELRIEPLGDAAMIDHDAWQELVEVLQKTEDASLAQLKGILSPALAVDRKAKDQAVGQNNVSHLDHKGTQSIKVPPERLDQLVNLVGELVIVQARLSQAALSSTDATLLSISEQVETLVWELRDNAMSIRMLPIGTTFGKFRRLVHDLSAELGKEIQLATEGEETELDKTVIERLGDPMVHMIRNCIDHGIEKPDDRLAAGKPRMGTIRLSAVHCGANVHITIADDGSGLDIEAIRQKAIAQGLLAQDAQATEQELFALIFQPGFSTARTVTNVSGRGVGMDVVRRGIEDLGGQIEVSSTRHKGTVITLKLPLTLAIVEGLLIKVGPDLYIIPLSIVKECVELPRGEKLRGNGGEILNVRGEIVPYVPLREYYGSPDPHPDYEYVVIVESDSVHVGFVVDAVLGQHQTVIKALGAMYRNVRGVSGATIMGDGAVALIIDVPSILADVQEKHPQAVQPETA